MENKKYFVKIIVGNRFKKVTDMTYILGVIRGVTLAINNDGDNKYAHVGLKDGTTIVCLKCTKEKYEKITAIINDMYPNLCNFSIKDEEEN